MEGARLGTALPVPPLQPGLPAAGPPGQPLFSQKSNLTRHIRVHTGFKPFQCPICHKCFTQNATLQDHLNLHSGIKPHRCNYCEMHFTHKPGLRRHLKELHGKSTVQNSHEEIEEVTIDFDVRGGQGSGYTLNGRFFCEPKGALPAPTGTLLGGFAVESSSCRGRPPASTVCCVKNGRGRVFSVEIAWLLDAACVGRWLQHEFDEATRQGLWGTSVSPHLEGQPCRATLLLFYTSRSERQTLRRRTFAVANGYRASHVSLNVGKNSNDTERERERLRLRRNGPVCALTSAPLRGVEHKRTGDCEIARLTKVQNSRCGADYLLICLKRERESMIGNCVINPKAAKDKMFIYGRFSRLQSWQHPYDQCSDTWQLVRIYDGRSVPGGWGCHAIPFCDLLTKSTGVARFTSQPGYLTTAVIHLNSGGEKCRSEKTEDLGSGTGPPFPGLASFVVFAMTSVPRSYPGSGWAATGSHQSLHAACFGSHVSARRGSGRVKNGPVSSLQSLGKSFSPSRRLNKSLRSLPCNQAENLLLNFLKPTPAPGPPVSLCQTAELGHKPTSGGNEFLDPVRGGIFKTCFGTGLNQEWDTPCIEDLTLNGKWVEPPQSLT
ncbi:Zinc finger and BTB domain-containing protein 26, partial [Ophiophagus hannah]